MKAYISISVTFDHGGDLAIYVTCLKHYAEYELPYGAGPPVIDFRGPVSGHLIAGGVMSVPAGVGCCFL